MDSVKRISEVYYSLGSRVTIKTLLFILTTSVMVAIHSYFASSGGEFSSAEQTPLESLLTELQSAAYASYGDNGFDSKLYVDLPLKTSLANARAAFEALPRLSNGTISSALLKDYINNFYDAAGSDLLPYTPTDYKDEPDAFLPLVQNPEVRAWALKINGLWLQLCRKVADDVLNQSDLHTLLPLPHPVIVPGSRFREIYYWDSYWIIRGLVASKMLDTAKGIVQNLLSLVENYGFVPNGARTYYRNRSQPPLLSEMVRVVYERTIDLGFLRAAFPLLTREHRYWNSALHRVHIKDKSNKIHLLNRYSANWYGPRPEAFIHDEQIVQNISESKRKYVYHEIASTAETGWDFSSRWMEKASSLTSLRTSLIVPVDLNSYLFQMENNIAYFARELGKKGSFIHFRDAAEARRLAIDTILWNDQAGRWLDFWIPSTKKNIGISKIVHSLNDGALNHVDFPSNFIPLWCGLLREGDSRFQVVLKAFKSSGLLYPTGIATSLTNSTQQWDFPDAWPPLQHMMIEALSRDTSSAAMAELMSRRWIQTTYASFNQTGQMLEKLNVQGCGKIGNGGEYTVQAGFGWSNGVILALLEKYGWEKDITLACI